MIGYNDIEKWSDKIETKMERLLSKEISSDIMAIKKQLARKHPDVDPRYWGDIMFVTLENTLYKFLYDIQIRVDQMEQIEEITKGDYDPHIKEEGEKKINIHEYAKEVNELIGNNGRFYLTQWGWDHSEESYFIDESHHGFMNGLITIENDKVIVGGAPVSISMTKDAMEEIARRHNLVVEYQEG